MDPTAIVMVSLCFVSEIFLIYMIVTGLLLDKYYRKMKPHALRKRHPGNGRNLPPITPRPKGKPVGQNHKYNYKCPKNIK